MADAAAPIQSSQRFRLPVITTKINVSVVVFGIFAIIAVLRSRREDIPKIVEMVLSSYLFCILGWALAVLILLGSLVFIKLLFRIYDKEIDRLSRERDELQTKLLKK